MKVLRQWKCYDISIYKNQRFRTLKHLNNATHIERDSEVHLGQSHLEMIGISMHKTSSYLLASS